MLKDVYIIYINIYIYIHSISPDFGYPSAQTFNQRPENLGKPPHAKTMNPGFIDVGGCESSNYQILGSKDIKRHQKKPCHNDIQKNHSTQNAS